MPCNPRDTAIQGQEVSLQIQYYDNCNKKVMADETPTITITDQDGNIIVETTDNDVSHLGDGLYEYIYRVPSDIDSGVWTDQWTALIDEAEFTTSMEFTVVPPSQGLSATSGPGKILLGDDVFFDFTDEELYGLNVLLKFLKQKLRSVGKKPVRDINGSFVTDGYGEVLTEDCDIFPEDILITFLCQSLSEFNSTPFFTGYTFGDPTIYTMFNQIIIEGAYVYAIASQSILEKGRDFTITNGGANYQAPQLGDFLQSHYGTWLTSYRERLKFIKNNIRPGARSFGSYSNMGSRNPAWTRLRHLRQRRIY